MEQENMFNIPILLIIFKREDTTIKVLNRLRELKPKELYVAADGPRNEEEREKCLATRKLIETIDWDCNVHTLFQDKNLGCCNAPVKAITWFFDNVEMGIILEDDILADISFFNFCKVLLEKYKDDERVMHIAGENPHFKAGSASYYFATVQHCWGWASWRRAWKHYDSTLKTISYRNVCKVLKKRYKDLSIREYWRRWFFRIADINTWDYQWTYTIISLDGICINPNNNLVSNIGFGEDSTHTSNPNDKNSNRKIEPITEIIHPEKIELNLSVDEEISLDRFNIQRYSFKRAIKRETLRVLKQIKNFFIRVFK